MLGLEPAGGMDMGGAELIATGFDDDLGLQPDSSEATPEFGGELLAGIEEPLATRRGRSRSSAMDADLDDMADSTWSRPRRPRSAPSPAVGESVAELQDAILDNPDDPALHRRLAEALASGGEDERALEELDLALRRVRARRGLRRRRRRGGSAGRARARRDPTPPEAGRAGVPTRRAGAAAGGVSRAGRRAGAGRRGRQGGGRLHPGAGARPRQRAGGGGAGDAGDHARAPSSPTRRPARARGSAAEAASAPAPPATAGAAEGGNRRRRRGRFRRFRLRMVLDETGPRDTRMRVDRREPEGDDEQREFQEMLEQFKRGIDQNIDDDDYQAHYDLGVAFKEMGLLDEAIAEFQKALRSPEGRLRTSEALGIAFFEKGQFAIAEAVLRRAVETVDGRRRGEDRPALLAGPRARSAGQRRPTRSPPTSAPWRSTSASWTWAIASTDSPRDGSE